MPTPSELLIADLSATLSPWKLRLHIAEYPQHIIKRGHHRAACFVAEERDRTCNHGSVRHRRKSARRLVSTGMVEKALELIKMLRDDSAAGRFSQAR